METQQQSDFTDCDEQNCYVEDPNDDIYLMELAYRYLSALPKNRQNDEYESITRRIKTYLGKYCIHSIVRDVIDITPEYSKTIHYCKNCNMNLDDIQLLLTNIA